MIGITCNVSETNYDVPVNYVRAVREAGGVPVIIAPEPDEVEQLMEKLDGVVLIGGVDVDPHHFDEPPHPNLGGVQPRRDAFELAVARAAHRAGKPTFGICRGCQVMAVAGGGKLLQDVPSQHPGAIQHAQKAPRSHGSHAVTIDEGTLLHRIAAAPEVYVNSFHHQAVASLPPGWRITAHAPDGLVEGFEDPAHPYWLAVQWHPEGMVTDETARRLFEAFVRAASKVTADVG